MFLDTYANKAKGWFQYMAAMIISDKRYCWNILYNYDKNVRLDLSKDPFKCIGPHDVIRWQDVTGYVKVCLGNFFSFLPNSPVCSPHGCQWQVTRREEERSAKGTCHKFNAHNCTCKNVILHICAILATVTNMALLCARLPPMTAWLAEINCTAV